MSGSRLVTIDCQYVMPQLAAAYLRVEDGEAAFIEVNTSHSLPQLLAALEAEGLAPAAVKYVIVTHAHLDHAGGASAVMAACPNATLLAHPRAAKHLIDPTRLVASARSVYGEDLFEKLYGRIDGIPAARVKAMDDGATVTLGGATLSMLHTRGHANHHFVVHDEAQATVYTGDTFGLVYPALQRAGRFAYPSTSPTDFDGPAALASLARIRSLRPRGVALTHFGRFEDVDAIAEQLTRWLEFSTKLCDEGKASGDELGTLEQRFRRALRQQLEVEASRVGLTLTADDEQLVTFDLELNAQGLAFAAVRQREAAAKPPPA
jgi:glyoxylase-like metal-dependent hydrolase (beta-lactamase superfamily II)